MTTTGNHRFSSPFDVKTPPGLIVLAERPRSHREDGFLYVHGSARNPLNEYVFPEDIYNQRKMERIFALVERYCFQGHTHVPGLFTENLQFHSPE